MCCQSSVSFFLVLFLFLFLFRISFFVLIFISYFLFRIDKAAKKALGILLSVIVLWSTEALPIYATALLIPLPAILLQTSLEGHCSLVSPENILTTIPCSDDKTCQLALSPLQKMVGSDKKPDFAGLTEADIQDPVGLTAAKEVATKCLFTEVPSQVAAKKIASMFFAPIAFQFLGIFAIASALKKLGLDRKLASVVLG